LLSRLKKLAKSHPRQLFPLGFTTTVERVMSAADLVVTKPGGLTVSECLALGKPMLLISPIPGQEEHNAIFLMEEGAAWLAYDAIGLEYKLARLLGDAAKLRVMAGASQALGRPQAAREVLQRVLEA
jgi:processive 1,2-diacylglycerol beta-glucosyltransferase